MFTGNRMASSLACLAALLIGCPHLVTSLSRPAAKEAHVPAVLHGAENTSAHLHLQTIRSTHERNSPVFSDECFPGPCEVNTSKDGVDLRMAIFLTTNHVEGNVHPTIARKKPAVLVWHEKWDLEQAFGMCSKVFVPAGFVCVCFEFPKFIKGTAKYEETAIKFLNDHASLYMIDIDKIFMYGYGPAGTFPLLNLLFYHTSSEILGRVKGMISDSGSPVSEEYDWKTLVDQSNSFIAVPPFLMMHCGGDSVTRPKHSVRLAIEQIDEANLLRPSDQQINYHWLKYKKETQCDHDALILDMPYAAEWAVSYMQQILVGGDPWARVPTELFRGTTTSTTPNPEGVQQ